MPQLERTHTCDYTVGKFLTLSEDKWLAKMKKHAHQPPSPSQIAAWSDSFRVLQQTFQSLPADYHNLYVIFEYVLPGDLSEPDNGPEYYVFADAILLSKQRVVVLEFKRRREVFVGHVRQTHKYRCRIQAYHDESRGMNKGAILVLTRATGLRERYKKVDCCSTDLLAAVIKDQFAAGVIRHPDAKMWCASTFSCHKKPHVKLTPQKQQPT